MARARSPKTRREISAQRARTIMHNADTFGPFLNDSGTCKLHMSRTVREQELVILRMTSLFQSSSVWNRHV